MSGTGDGADASSAKQNSEEKVHTFQGQLVVVNPSNSESASAVNEVETTKSFKDRNPHYFRMLALLENAYNHTTIDAKVVTPEGATIEVDRCEITVRPGGVKCDTQVVVKIIPHPEGLPSSMVPISQVLSKVAQFDHPVHVELAASVTPIDGQLRVKILCSDNGGGWEMVTTTKFKDYAIGFETPRFCSYIAVIPPEDLVKVYFHLFCDAWVHRETGEILCFFFKYRSELQKNKKIMRPEHESILSLPEEIIANVGDTVEVKLVAKSHPHLTVTNEDPNNGIISIDKDLLTKNFDSMLFKVSFPMGEGHPKEWYCFHYNGTVIDESGNPINGGFQSMFYFSWPLDRGRRA